MLTHKISPVDVYHPEQHGLWQRHHELILKDRGVSPETDGLKSQVTGHLVWHSSQGSPYLTLGTFDGQFLTLEGSSWILSGTARNAEGAYSPYLLDYSEGDDLLKWTILGLTHTCAHATHTSGPVQLRRDNAGNSLVVIVRSKFNFNESFCFLDAVSYMRAKH